MKTKKTNLNLESRNFFYFCGMNKKLYQKYNGYYVKGLSGKRGYVCGYDIYEGGWLVMSLTNVEGWGENTDNYGSAYIDTQNKNHKSEFGYWFVRPSDITVLSKGTHFAFGR